MIALLPAGKKSTYHDRRAHHMKKGKLGPFYEALIFQLLPSLVYLAKDISNCGKWPQEK